MLEHRSMLTVFAYDDTYEVLHDQPLMSGSVLSNDSQSEMEQLIATLASGPTQGTLVLNSDGNFTYTPPADFAGQVSFIYTASFGSESDQATATINVTNNAPIADDGSDSVVHDQTLVSTVYASDLDGDWLTYTLAAGPYQGTLNLNSSGNFSYTPGVHFVGNETFTFAASDGITSDTATFTINVTNNAPVPTNGNESVLHDQTLNSSIDAYDLDGDNLTFSVVTGPAHGALTLYSAGSFSYTPATHFVGDDSFSFSVTDGVATVNGTFTIHVTNNAPVASDGTATTTEDEPVSSNAVANDLDGDNITYSLVSDPSYGSLTFNSDGSFTYTPDPGFSNTDGFVFAATDGIATDTATILIHVGAGVPSGPALSINIVAPGFIVANDDDDNENSVVDTSDQQVPADDELVPVTIAVANPDSVDLTNYVVEVGAFGAVALWLSQKGNPVPAGTQFPADAIPPMFVEGKFESAGQIAATLFKPGAGIAAVKDKSIEVGEIRIRRDGAGELELTQTTVWVGEKMNLDVAGKNVTGVHWFGISDADTFKHWGQEAGGDPSNSFAQEYELTAADRQQQDIHFYWVVDGLKKVAPAVTYIDPLTGLGHTVIRSAARFDVKRPSADLATSTTAINFYDTAGGKQVVFADKLNDEEGITFIRVNDPQAGGTYQWVQLVDHSMRIVQWNLEGQPVEYVRITAGFVLDNPYPYGQAVGSLAWDSPSNTVQSPAGSITSLLRQDQFRMFLLWKPDTPGAQYVPLRVVAWEWGFLLDAGSPGGTWTLMGPYHSVNPPSQNTYEVPEWTSKADDYPLVESL